MSGTGINRRTDFDRRRTARRGGRVATGTACIATVPPTSEGKTPERFFPPHDPSFVTQLLAAAEAGPQVDSPRQPRETLPAYRVSPATTCNASSTGTRTNRIV